MIATDQHYRQNFTAADDSRTTKIRTIRTIIDMIVCTLSCPLLLSPLLSSTLYFILLSLKHTEYCNIFSLSSSLQTNETKDVVSLGVMFVYYYVYVISNNCLCTVYIQHI